MDIYKIVKIIDEYRIVINAGANDGIKSGEVFEIFVPGEMVIDIDTKKELGTLDFIKAKVEVDTVYPNMCICVNNIKSSANPLSLIAKSGLAFYGGDDNTPEPLKIDMLEVTGGLSDYSKKIKIGDSVRNSLG